MSSFSASVTFDESSRRTSRTLTATRTHLSLEKDAPDGRNIEPPSLGAVLSIPEVGGLHHRYSRRAA
jgi:hypothetical protein